MGNKDWQKPSELMPASVWKPNEGSQAVAFDLQGNEILYWGDRGPGKTSWQIARALSRFFLGYGRKYKVLMMGLRIKSLAGCVAEVEKILRPLERRFGIYCRRNTQPGDWKWTAPDGEEFRIINLKTVEQAEDMIGQEYNVQMWNELCHYPSPRLYIMLSGSNRSSFDPVADTPRNSDGSYQTVDGNPLPPSPEEILSASNTKGVGKLWVRKKFIEIAEGDENNCQLREAVVEHEVRDEKVEFKTVSIQGIQTENPKLTARYLASLREQTKHDPVLRREWCEGGDWYTPSGGALDHIWDADKHVLMGDVKIPRDWDLGLSVFFSSARPTCVLWTAENMRAERLGGYEIPRGSLVIFNEIYLCDEGDPHLGTRVTIRELGRLIKEESKRLVDEGVCARHVVSGFGSRQLFVPVADGALADRLADIGIYLDEVDTAKQTNEVKQAGLSVVREGLSASAFKEEDGIYFTYNCENCVRTLPDLPVDGENPDIVDEEGEFYCYEAVRLRAMSMSLPVEDLKIGYN